MIDVKLDLNIFAYMERGRIWEKELIKYKK